jgi:hypothetical protein
LVKVSFHSTPVVGARIALNKAINASGDGVVATAKTDSRGVARFDAIPKGSYYPDSTDGLLFSSILLIKVETGRASGEKLKLDWPEYSVGTQNLRGRFTVSDQLDDPGIPLRNAPVEL